MNVPLLRQPGDSQHAQTHTHTPQQYSWTTHVCESIMDEHRYVPGLEMR